MIVLTDYFYYETPVDFVIYCTLTNNLFQLVMINNQIDNLFKILFNHKI